MPREQVQAEAAQAEDARREQLLASVATRVLAVVSRSTGITGAKAIEKVIACRRGDLYAAWQMLAAQGRITNAGGTGRSARWVVATSAAGDGGDEGQGGQTADEDDGFGGL